MINPVNPVGGEIRSANEMIDAVLQLLHSVSDKLDIERELAAIIAWLPGIIARFDTHYRHVFISPQIEKLSGEKPDFYIGKSHEDLELDHVMQARWRGIFDFAIRNQSIGELEHYVTDSRGSKRFFITRVIPLINTGSDVTGFLTISSDHSDRERRAAVLRAEGAELRRADDKKNEYLATLAHELRGPLAPISSAVQLMKLSTNPAAFFKAREIIERQVTQMAGLIDDLMQVGRISSGKLDVNLKPVSVDMIMRDVMESTQPVFTAKSQNFEVIEIPPNLWVNADTIRLTQLLTNLLVNASKYSPTTTQIRLEVVKVAEFIEFRVSDQGIGLTKESIRDIFDMFAQVHSTGKNARGGLGIGLALAKQIAKLHKGDIYAYSDGLGRGSTFTFKMPFIDAPRPKEFAIPQAPINKLPMRILVVDDNIDGANSLADMLSEMGHIVTKAYDGTNAILLLENEPFDLAFLDLGLPDKTGIEVALTVSKKQMNENVRLIALTGLSRERDRLVTRAAGFEEHLVKPITLGALLRLVGKVTPLIN